MGSYWIMFQLCAKDWWMKPTIENTLAGWLAGLRTGWDFHSQRFASPSARSGSEMKNDGNQTAHPFSLHCFLCGRFSVGSNESRRRLFARSIAALWERRRRMMEWRVKKKREKDGERGQCVVMWSWTVFRLCSWQILHISASSICPSVSLSLVAPRKKRTGREGFADLFFFLGSVLSFFSELFHNMSVHPSQPSAGVGFQLDDPLPSMVTVVQVQKVCVWIQAVLTCRKHTEKPLLKATVIIS